MPTRHEIDVLIVDDNQDAATLLALAMEGYGHRAGVSFTITEALELARHARPSVAILDIGLDGESGVDLGRQLRQIFGPEICIIALTGWGHDEVRRETTEAGFDLHLLKPASVPEITSFIAAWVERRAAAVQ